MEHGSRTRLVTAVMLAVVFVSGLLLGLAADSNLSAEPPAVVATAPEGDEPEAEPRRRYIYEQVEPTPEQSALIDSMMNDYRESRESLEEELEAESRAPFDPMAGGHPVPPMPGQIFPYTPRRVLAEQSVAGGVSLSDKDTNAIEETPNA